MATVGLIIALLCAVGALVYGVQSVKWVLAKDAGNPRMQEIAAAVQEGAKAYLDRQYTTIAIAGVIIGVIIFTIISYGLAFIGVNPNWQLIIKGIIICSAVALDMRKNAQ